MEKFPRLFKRAIPFRMNIRLEDFVKEYICMEQDIHIEDMQESVQLYGRMCRKIEAAMREIEELNGQSAATRIGIVAPVEFTHVIHADFSQMRMSAGPQAVKIIFDLCPPEKTSLQPAIDLTRAFMQAHRLKPVCEGYTRQYAWFVDPDGQMRHYSELIVPVTAE